MRRPNNTHPNRAYPRLHALVATTVTFVAIPVGVSAEQVLTTGPRIRIARNDPGGDQADWRREFLDSLDLLIKSLNYDLPCPAGAEPRDLIDCFDKAYQTYGVSDWLREDDRAIIRREVDRQCALLDCAPEAVPMNTRDAHRSVLMELRIKVD